MAGLQIADRMTSVVLQSNYSIGGGGGDADTFHKAIHPLLYRPTPLRVVCSITHGARVESIVPSTTGTQSLAGGASFRLIAALPGALANGGYSTTSRTPGIEIAEFDYLTETTEPMTTYFVAVSNWLPARQIEPLDAEGNALKAVEQTNHGAYQVRTVEGTPDRVAQWRVRSAPHHATVVFDLPTLPGPLPQNGQVDNLFLLKMPHISFEYEYQLREFIWQAAQLQDTYSFSSNPAFPPGFFPLELRDATVLDALEIYQRYFPDEPQVKIDPATLSMKLESPPMDNWWIRLIKRIL